MNKTISFKVFLSLINCSSKKELLQLLKSHPDLVDTIQQRGDNFLLKAYVKSDETYDFFGHLGQGNITYFNSNTGRINFFVNL